MGKRSTKSNAALKAQAKKILPSGGGDGSGVGGSVSEAIQSLSVQLVRLDLSVFAQVVTGADLRVIWSGTAFQALFQGQRLGDLPAHCNGKLSPAYNYEAVVVRLSAAPPAVTIEVSF